MNDPRPTVFIVIPVFNRLNLTKECLDCLRVQSYSPMHLIVVDGGSTDGTKESLAQSYPDVVVLGGTKELWWGDAMQLGIDYCLQQSRGEDDMVLMMNNDALIGRGYVETLVRVSRERDAAVGGLIVDSRDPSRILDAGEFVDWKTYAFPVKRTIGPGETFYEGVDVLPGRGTLIPLFMIRQAGNVNAELFPHYIADYEFFSRLKQHGFRLGVTYEATIRSHVEETGLFAETSASLTICQAVRALVSRRSMDNVRDHWRFIEHAAPAPLRGRLKRQLIRRSAYLVVSRTKLRCIGLPLAWFLAGSYYVTKNDCAVCGCDPDDLVAGGILRPWIRSDWYVFPAEFEGWISGGQELKRLYRRGWNPVTKFSRWVRAKSYVRFSGRGYQGTAPQTEQEGVETKLHIMSGKTNRQAPKRISS